MAGVGADEVRAFCEDLRALIKAETGLVASIGAGAGKQVAKIASGLAKPDGVAVIPPGMQHELLDPLPVRKLWGGSALLPRKSSSVSASKPSEGLPALP